MTDTKIPTHIEQDVVRILWNKFKPYVLYVCIIVVSFLIFNYVVIPQYQDLGRIREEEKKTQTRITLLRNNLQLLTSLDDSVLSKQFDEAFMALPAEKDFVGIINGITRSAAEAGVNLNDFSFNVGILATESAAPEVQPSIKIALAIQGTVERSTQFAKSLSETFPLSSPVSMSLTKDSSSIEVSFFYKPYVPLSDDGSPLPLLTASDKKLLDSLEPVYNKIKQQENGEASVPVTISPTALPVQITPVVVSPTPPLPTITP